MNYLLIMPFTELHLQKASGVRAERCSIKRTLHQKRLADLQK